MDDDAGSGLTQSRSSETRDDSAACSSAAVLIRMTLYRPSSTGVAVLRVCAIGAGLPGCLGRRLRPPGADLRAQRGRLGSALLSLARRQQNRDSQRNRQRERHRVHWARYRGYGEQLVDLLRGAVCTGLFGILVRCCAIG